MLYYSEILGTIFNTEGDCREAEAAYYEAKKKTEAEEQAKKNEAFVAQQKNEAAQKVELAEKRLSEAYANYEKVSAEVKKILEESNKRMLDIIKPAKEAIADAEKARYKAVCDYNAAYGPYTTTYSAERAKQDFNRLSSWIEGASLSALIKLL